MKWKKCGACPALWILALCFLAGMIPGQILASGMPDAVAGELERYLSSRQVPGVSAGPVILSTILLYLRYPLLAVFLGFTAVGTALLCGTAAAFGFFLSFSVGCFTAAFGGNGVLLALAALGIRCLTTLPCFFLLAAPAMETSVSLFRAAFGKRPRVPALDGWAWGRRLAFCAAVLALGVCAELLAVPRLLAWAMARTLG